MLPSNILAFSQAGPLGCCPSPPASPCPGLYHPAVNPHLVGLLRCCFSFPVTSPGLTPSHPAPLSFPSTQTKHLWQLLSSPRQPPHALHSPERMPAGAGGHGLVRPATRGPSGAFLPPGAGTCGLGAYKGCRRRAGYETAGPGMLTKAGEAPGPGISHFLSDSVTQQEQVC